MAQDLRNPNPPHRSPDSPWECPNGALSDLSRNAELQSPTAATGAVPILPSNSQRSKDLALRWEELKPEIETLYISEWRTLDETMRLVKERHGFKAS